MSDLKTFDNLYTSLSQSAYEDRPRNFKERSSEDVPGEINYAEDYEEDRIKIDGGKNLPNNGIVYVHKR
mgnify:FL=1|jgi:hypothetical protein